MTAFSIVIVPAKRLANGKHRVRIAVAHRSQTRYIATPFIIDSASQFRNGRVVRHEKADSINRNLHRKIDEYVLMLAGIDYAGELTCTELIHYLLATEKRKPLTLSVLADEFLKGMENEERFKSYKLYRTALNHFYHFFGKHVLLKQLTPSLMQGYMEELHKERLSVTTIRIYMTLIKVLVNYGIKMDYVHYSVHPFAVCKLPVSRVRELDLSRKELKRIRDLVAPNRQLAMTCDLFMLTYYLGGINLKDLLEYRFTDKYPVLRYVRHKTRRSKRGDYEIVFRIQPEARSLIEKYRSPDGRLVFGSFDTYNKVYSLIYRNLKKVAVLAGVTSRLSYYSARKSFAQHGYDAGIQVETIEYCIGHSMKANRPVCNYIRVMQKHADMAMRKIFDRLL